MIWVADDGSWGAGKVKAFDSDKWTDSDIEEIANASDAERLATAYRIAARRIGPLQY